MTTRRSTLLTLALLALLIAFAFVRNAMAASGASTAPGVADAQPTPLRQQATSSQAAHARYFVSVSHSNTHTGFAPSAAANRQFTRSAASLRVQLGLSSTDPVALAAIYPAHTARAISVAEAHRQAQRVAQTRALPIATVLALVDQHSERFIFGGDAQVNLHMLNIALDEIE